MHTLYALKACKEQLGVKTVLGVSNVSFGLPCRDHLNATFLTLAMAYGLDLAIVNPNVPAMMGAVDAYRVLTGRDVKSAAYLARYAGAAAQPAMTAMAAVPDVSQGLARAVEQGLREEAAAAARAALATAAPLQLVDEVLIPALDRVGQRYERGEVFLPQLLQAATAAQSAFEAARPCAQWRHGGRARPYRVGHRQGGHPRYWQEHRQGHSGELRL